MTLLEAAKKADEEISALHRAFGSPGDWGYEKREGKALFEIYKFQQELRTSIRGAEDSRLIDARAIAGILQEFNSQKMSSSQTTDAILELFA